MMRLKPAHDAANQEDITAICTNRLWAKVLESTTVPPLPKMGVWVTAEPYRRRSFWKWLRRIKKEKTTHLSVAARWDLDYSGAGRKGTRLVVELSVKWVIEGITDALWWGCKWDRGEDTSPDNYTRRHTFVTDVEIFPLTPQQAAFVGAKNLESIARPHRDHIYVYWGTAEDIKEIEEKFSIARSY